jgi:predicted metalloprotease
MPKILKPVLLSWLLAGCGSPTGSSDDPREDLLVLYESARDDAEVFWDELYRVKGLDYRPIAGFTPYSAQIAVPCGETQLWDVLYCETNEKVYFHIDLLDEIVSVAGEAAAAVVIAHEVGHHVSDLNGMYVAWKGGFVRGKELELQADCYAGAVAAAGALSGPLTGEATIRELMELVDSRDDLRWFNAAIHGTSDQRVRAFLLGLQGGNVACQEILQFRGF